jgi:hypothetical protein
VGATKHPKTIFWSNLMMRLKMAFLLGFSSIFLDLLGGSGTVWTPPLSGTAGGIKRKS